MKYLYADFAAKLADVFTCVDRLVYANEDLTCKNIKADFQLIVNPMAV